MARIAGVDIPNNKRVEIALTYIYGIGRKSANDILAKTGINPDTRAKDLTEEEVALCDPIDYTVLGILQARILEWVAVPFSRGSSQPRDRTQVSHIAGGFFTQLNHQGSDS